ncbi:tyrosine-type recombinase/integrase [Amycolatopsis thermalba]|uniref:Tyrosine-type recombinase/integrase n=1 Tax=Amycolatopsis thermalba TaxID=944492 RepID=A0ABY4NSG8_9PSEU|nr:MULTISPECIES: tyrosine-type recombinase/integrase [Amycolatopsis]UQS22997.1 tyrosine-type recombinase/integrase [Amycolatopsis thermalba]
MTDAKKRTQRRQRGEIETLPSGALRVKVYAGVDPLSGKRHYLRETIPAGPKAEAEAEKVLVRFVNQVNESRNPRTRATVSQLLDRYMEFIDIDVTTRTRYEIAIRKHIKPLLGNLPIAKLNGETFDSFYKTLRTCRDHCGGRPSIDHRVKGEHECTDKCRVHKCDPLSPASIRKIHTCLSGALKTAIRWQWITVNPLDQAHPPKRPTPDPRPPSPEEATAIVNEAFKDLPWGMLVWLAMTTGARRGELCALRWDWLDLDNATLRIHTSIAQDGGKTWEKDTKTHQQRRITLDPETVGLLRAYRQHCESGARSVGVTLPKNGRLFSPEVDHSTWLKPSTVTQRYRRMSRSLGLETHLHQLRHYSATELIAAGVDVRTVAGRLGHSGGGTTTLKVYSAWVAEADQKAAGKLTGRMPQAPITIDVQGNARSTLEPEAANPYQKIAADLRGAITAGILREGEELPPVADLASRYHVSVGTAHRAIAELKTAGLVTASRGRRVTVVHLTSDSSETHNVVDIGSKRSG